LFLKKKNDIEDHVILNPRLYEKVMPQQTFRDKKKKAKVKV